MAGNDEFQSTSQLSDGGDSDSSDDDLRYPKFQPNRHIPKRCPPPSIKSEPSCFDVACQILIKWGWQKGKGLGKYGHGITHHLLPHLRPKLSGLGAPGSGDNSTTRAAAQEVLQELLPRKRKAL